VEWFDDYFEGIKTYTVCHAFVSVSSEQLTDLAVSVFGCLVVQLPVDSLCPARVCSSEAAYRDDGTDAYFPLFSWMGNPKYLFPSRLCVRGQGMDHSGDGDGDGHRHIPVVLSSSSSAAQSASAALATSGVGLAAFSGGGSNGSMENQRKALALAYETVGKVLNQMLREGILIPQSFSSPLLLRFLLYGVEGLKMSGSLYRSIYGDSETAAGLGSLVSEGFLEDVHRYEADDLYRYMLDLDFDSFSCTTPNPRGKGKGTIAAALMMPARSSATYLNDLILYLKDSKNYSVESLYDHVLYPHILKPRMEALQLIKKGFNLVPLVPNFLRTKVPLSVFTEYFVAKEFVDAAQLMKTVREKGATKDILDALVQSSRLPSFAVVTTAGSTTIGASIGDAGTGTGNGKKKQSQQLLATPALAAAEINMEAARQAQAQAIAIVKEAISKLSPEECTGLLKFWTGSGSYMPSVTLLVSLQPYFTHDSIIVSYPEFPLAKSLTCACHLFVPFVFRTESLLLPAGAKAPNASRAGPSCLQSTVESVRTNLINSCMNLAGDYSDKAVIYGR
jgi:hypothetical protein